MDIRGIFSKKKRLSLILIFSFCASGCWKSEVKPPVYRKISAICRQVQLNSETLDVAALRSLMQCIDSQLHLGPFAQLINGPDGLTDTQLQPLVQVLQEYLLNDRDRLQEIDRSLHFLKKRGLFDSMILNVTQLLDAREPIDGLISFLRTQFRKSLQSQPKKVFDTLKWTADPLLEKAWPKTFDIVLTFTDSKILRESLLASENSTASSKLIAESVFNYLKQPHTFSCNGTSVPVQRELIQSIQDGSLFTLSEQIFGTRESEIQEKIPQIVALLKATLQPRPDSTGTILDSMLSAIQSLNGEIACMKSSQSIPNGALYLFQELSAQPASTSASEYILQGLPLTLVSLKPFCEYPSTLVNDYPALTQLARTGAMEILGPLLQKLYSIEKPELGCPGTPPSPTKTDHPLAKFFIHLLDDQQDGFKLLIPAITEMTHQGNWSNLLLLLALPNTETQKNIQEVLLPLTQPHALLSQRSFVEVMLESLTDLDFPTFFQLFTHAKKLFLTQKELWSPALLSLRNFYYASDTHPFLELARDILQNSKKNQAFIESLFSITENRYFLDSLAYSVTMAKDGRLESLTWTLLDLFHGANSKDHDRKNQPRRPQRTEYSENSREQVIPRYISGARHQLTSRRLPIFTLDSTLAQKVSPQCDQMNLNFSFADSSSPLFDAEVQKLIRCQNGLGNDTDVTQALQFFVKTQTENGISFFKYQLDLFKKNVNDLQPSEIQFLTENWKKYFDQGKFFNLINAIPLWVKGSTQPPVLQPLLEVLHGVLQTTRKPWERLQSFLGHWMEKPEAPKLLGDLDDLLHSTAISSSGPLERVFNPSFKARIKKWVEYKECAQREKINERTEEVLREAQTLLTNWDLRKAWSWEGPQGLKSALEPNLKKLGDKNQSISSKWILDALLNSLKYFSSGDPLAQYDIPYLIDWLHKRSIDYRPITYYYPGETSPRVRIVNTLDLFEIMLNNGDFDAPPPLNKNMALEFASELGKAWGDVADRTQWPQEIQTDFPAPKRPLKLAQAVENIVNRPFNPDTDPGFDNLKQLIELYMGLPKFPNCHRSVPGEAADPQWPTGGAQYFMPPELIWDFQTRLYNITQALSVLKENTPGSGIGYNGGLEVLRNLIFEIDSSTPPALRNASAGSKNNLSLVLSLIRMGVLRHVGRVLQNFEANDPALLDFFTFVIQAAKNQNLRAILVYLLETDVQQKLTWQVISQLFQYLDKATPTEIQDLKDFGFYALAWFNRLARPDLLNIIFEQANPALIQSGNFLSTQNDLLQDLLSLNSLALLTRGAYQTFVPARDQRLGKVIESVFIKPNPSDPTLFQDGLELLKSIYGDSSRTSWRMFLNRAKTLRNSPTYQTLQLTDAFLPLLRFFEQRENTDHIPPTADEIALSNKLRQRGAQLVLAKELDQILVLSKEHPEEFYRTLETFSRLLGSGDQGTLKEFFKMIRRSL